MFKSAITSDLPRTSQNASNHDEKRTFLNSSQIAEVEGSEA